MRYFQSTAQKKFNEERRGGDEAKCRDNKRIDEVGIRHAHPMTMVAFFNHAKASNTLRLHDSQFPVDEIWQRKKMMM